MTLLIIHSRRFSLRWVLSSESNALLRSICHTSDTPVCEKCSTKGLRFLFARLAMDPVKLTTDHVSVTKCVTRLMFRYLHATPGVPEGIWKQLPGANSNISTFRAVHKLLPVAFLRQIYFLLFCMITVYPFCLLCVRVRFPFYFTINKLFQRFVLYFFGFCCSAATIT